MVLLRPRMKPTWACVLLSIVASSAVASADVEQPTPAVMPAKTRGANAMSLGVGRVLEDTHDRMALSVEGSHRVGDSRTHVRIQFAASERDHDWDGLRSGRFEHVRVGVEGQTRGQMVRAFFGADLGIAFEHTTIQSVRDGVGPMRQVDASVISVPRVGIEVGDRVLARAGVEVIMARHDAAREYSLGMSLAVGTAF